MTTDSDTTKSALSVDQQQACSPSCWFCGSRPAVEIWRPYDAEHGDSYAMCENHNAHVAHCRNLRLAGRTDEARTLDVSVGIDTAPLGPSAGLCPWRPANASAMAPPHVLTQEGALARLRNRKTPRK